MNLKDKHDRWILHFWGFGLAAVVVGFFAQGEMALANPLHLATIGLGAGLAIIAGHSVALADDGKGELATAIATILTIAVGGLVIYEGAAADKDIQANIARCAVIQQDMLSVAPRRTDGADLFQALGCKPHGDGIVHWPAKVPSQQIAPRHAISSPRGDRPQSSSR